MKKSELTAFIKEEIKSTLNESVRDRLNDLAMNIGKEEFATSILKIPNEEVLDMIARELAIMFAPQGPVSEELPSKEEVEDVTAAVKDLKDELANLEEEEDKEPTKADLKATKGLAKAKEELAQLTKQMKSLARDYKEAEGAEKEKIVADLKKKTKLKKELEAIIYK